MDMTGYGRSTRPAADERSVQPGQDAAGAVRAGLIAAPCAPSYPHALTTIASDWNDIDAVVDYIRALRHVEKVSLVAWSLGGPRAGGYAAQHPEKVQTAGAARAGLQPRRRRGAAGEAAGRRRADQHAVARRSSTRTGTARSAAPISTTPRASDAVWSEMLASDPVGATWGPGVRRAPQTTTWGWNAGDGGEDADADADGAGAHDKQVPPDRVRELYADLGAQREGVRRSRRARRTTRCGRRITCCCSARRSSG